jgi:hypothetical protein
MISTTHFIKFDDFRIYNINVILDFENKIRAGKLVRLCVAETEAVPGLIPGKD